MTATHAYRAQLPPPPAKIHFVGIGGIGMSGLARIMQAQGYQVTGSDSTKSQATAALIAEGIPVVTGHEQTESAMHADLVVITAAVGAGNPEVEAARAAGVPVIKRAQLLGWLANRRLCIAVAGSHGKSSTSGMIASALVRLGADPAYAVGAILADTNTNAAPGDGPHMVVEADEYDRSFLTLRPDVAVITNVEFDHPDLFETQEVYDQAFLDFIAQIKPGGCLVYAGDDLGALRLLNRAALDPSIRLITFGERAGLDWRLSGTPGRWRLDGPSGASASFRLNVPGRHNARNAVAAIVVLVELGFSLQAAADAIAAYRGISRRFEFKGERGGVLVVDDYAHHPTEIAATLAAARDAYPDHRLWAVFQPHTYSRTTALLDEFAAALRPADRVVLLDIYAARETDDGTVSSDDLAARVGDNVMRTRRPDDTATALATSVEPGDLVLTIGAGTITNTGPLLLEHLAQRSRE